MDRKNYYFRQKVTDTELDGGFDYAENADHYLMSDPQMGGIYDGMGVGQHSVPNLSVDVDGPGQAYDAYGQRIAFASLQNCDVSVDHDGVSTAVVNPGNEKFISVFIKFKRVESDPRVDGYGHVVHFERSESWEFYVTQGSEAPITVPPTAPRPPLEADGLLLCDILLQHGDTQIFNTALFFDRRQDTFSIWLLGRYPGQMNVGLLKDAVDYAALLVDLHVSGALLNHYDEDSLASAYATGGTYQLHNGTVESQLHELLDAVNAVDSDLGDYLPLAGGTMSGNILSDVDGGHWLGSGSSRFRISARGIRTEGNHAGAVTALSAQSDDAGDWAAELQGYGPNEARALDCVHVDFATPIYDKIRASRLLCKLGEEVPADVEHLNSAQMRTIAKAWAYITAAGVILGPHFNVLSVSHVVGSGHYIVALDQEITSDANHYAIVAMPVGINDYTCVGGPSGAKNSLVIRTYQGGAPAILDDSDFMLIVFADGEP